MTALYRVFEHTADLGIEARGETPGEALANAASALTSILTGQSDPRHLGRPSQEVHFTVEAPDRDALVVALLSEVLWLFESQGLLWLGGGVHYQETTGLVRAEASGNALVHEAGRHGQGVEVKAVTYHGLHFRHDDGGWLLRVILDI